MFITVSVCIIDRVVFFHTPLSVSDSGKRIITEFYSKVIKHRHISFLHHQTLTLWQPQQSAIVLQNRLLPLLNWMPTIEAAEAQIMVL